MSDKNIPIHGKDCGPDDLQNVLCKPAGYGSTIVARWCDRCGAIVVDVDTDNRTSPGHFAKMRFPRNA